MLQSNVIETFYPELTRNLSFIVVIQSSLQLLLIVLAVAGVSFQRLQSGFAGTFCLTWTDDVFLPPVCSNK